MCDLASVFLLTTFACIGGCVYKYQKLHARGIEVLPFIDNYRAIYARFTKVSLSCSENFLFNFPF
jgi:hypothetical protein